MTHPLRNTITSNDGMIALRDSIRQTLTPSRTAKLFSNIVTDDKISDIILKAAGKKRDNLMKTRVADALTAEILGFPDTHAMFNFYHNQTQMERESYIFKHQCGADIIDVYVQKGVNFSLLDAIEFSYAEFDFYNIDNSFDFVSADGQIVNDIDIPDSFLRISEKDNVTGIEFDLRNLPHSVFSDMPALSESLSNEWLACVEHFTDIAGSGTNFVLSDDEALRKLSATDIEVFSLSQDQFTSRGGVLRSLLLGIDERDDQIDLSSIKDDIPSEGVINVGDNFFVHYDLKRYIALITKDNSPFSAHGLYVTQKDPRGKLLREIV